MKPETSHTVRHSVPCEKRAAPRKGKPQGSSQSSQEASAWPVMASTRTGQLQDLFHLDLGGSSSLSSLLLAPSIVCLEVSEMQIKAITECHLTSIEAAAIRKPKQKRQVELLLPQSSSQLSVTTTDQRTGRASGPAKAAVGPSMG